MLNGVSLDEFHPDGPRMLDADAPRVGVLGVLTPWKGQHLFLRAMSRVARQRPDARFVVAGSELYDTEQGGGYEARLRLLAAVPELTRILESAHDWYLRSLACAVLRDVTGKDFGVVRNGLAAAVDARSAAIAERYRALQIVTSESGRK